MKTLLVVPAYGKTFDNVAHAWSVAGHDFKIVGGPYISGRDTNALIRNGYTHAKAFNSNKMEDFIIIELNDKV